MAVDDWSTHDSKTLLKQPNYSLHYHVLLNRQHCGNSILPSTIINAFEFAVAGAIEYSEACLWLPQQSVEQMRVHLIQFYAPFTMHASELNGRRRISEAVNMCRVALMLTSLAAKSTHTGTRRLTVLLTTRAVRTRMTNSHVWGGATCGAKVHCMLGLFALLSAIGFLLGAV